MTHDTARNDTRTHNGGRHARRAALAAAIVAAGALAGAVAPRGEKLLLADARMIIEFNDTAQDVGIQMFIDGEPWKQLRATDPDGKVILNIRANNSLKLQGLTELFFESSEPALKEFSLDAFFKRFPEGLYELEGVTIDGEAIEGEAEFTHAIPEGPVILTPEDGSVQDPDNTIIAWMDVPDPRGSTIESYQVVVTQLNINVLPKRTFSVHLPASVTSVTVPAEFMLPDTEYDFEVLAIEAGGNQTITSGLFSTSP
jgi:hypothetical protein